MDRLTCARMFVAVMETGSFAAAAQKQGTSAGQASKLVARLEAELGARLLNRTTRAVTPTAVGQGYFDRLRPLLDDLEALDQSIEDASDAPRGRLRLTAPRTFGAMQLTPVLLEFAARYPEIDLEVDFSDRLVNLVDEGFDAAIRVGRPADSSLIGRKLCTAQIIAVASPQYLTAHGTPQVPGDLSGHRCIVDRNFRDPHRWEFANSESVSIKGRLSFSDAEACCEAAIAGHGIAYGPDFVAYDALAKGQLERILCDHAAPPFSVYALYPAGRHLAVKVRVLVDYLAKAFDPAPWARS